MAAVSFAETAPAHPGPYYVPFFIAEYERAYNFTPDKLLSKKKKCSEKKFLQRPIWKHAVFRGKEGRVRLRTGTSTFLPVFGDLMLPQSNSQMPFGVP